MGHPPDPFGFGPRNTRSNVVHALAYRLRTAAPELSEEEALEAAEAAVTGGGLDLSQFDGEPSTKLGVIVLNDDGSAFSYKPYNVVVNWKKSTAFGAAMAASIPATVLAGLVAIASASELPKVELSKREAAVAMVLWRYRSRMTKPFSELVADIEKKCDDLDLGRPTRKELDEIVDKLIEIGAAKRTGNIVYLVEEVAAAWNP